MKRRLKMHPFRKKRVLCLSKSYQAALEVRTFDTFRGFQDWKADLTFSLILDFHATGLSFLEIFVRTNIQ